MARHPIRSCGRSESLVTHAAYTPCWGRVATCDTGVRNCSRPRAACAYSLSGGGQVVRERSVPCRRGAHRSPVWPRRPPRWPCTSTAWRAHRSKPGGPWPPPRRYAEPRDRDTLRPSTRPTALGGWSPPPSLGTLTGEVAPRGAATSGRGPTFPLMTVRAGAAGRKQ